MKTTFDCDSACACNMDRSVVRGMIIFTLASILVWMYLSGFSCYVYSSSWMMWKRAAHLRRPWEAIWSRPAWLSSPLCWWYCGFSRVQTCSDTWTSPELPHHTSLFLPLFQPLSPQYSLFILVNVRLHPVRAETKRQDGELNAPAAARCCPLLLTQTRPPATGRRGDEAWCACHQPL